MVERQRRRSTDCFALTASITYLDIYNIMATTASAPGDKASALSGKGVVAPEILWAQRSSEDEADKVSVLDEQSSDTCLP